MSPSVARRRTAEVFKADDIRILEGRDGAHWSDLALAVIDAGYRSSSSSFKQIVCQTLSKNEHFGRAQYKAT